MSAGGPADDAVPPKALRPCAAGRHIHVKGVVAADAGVAGSKKDLGPIQVAQALFAGVGYAAAPVRQSGSRLSAAD